MSDRFIGGQLARRDTNIEQSVHAAAEDTNGNPGTDGSSGNSGNIGNSGGSSTTSAAVIGDLLNTKTSSSSQPTSTPSTQSGNEDYVTVSLDGTVFELSAQNLTVNYEVTHDVLFGDFSWLNSTGGLIYNGNPTSDEFDGAVFTSVNNSGVVINLSYLNQGSNTGFLGESLRFKVGWTSGNVAGDSLSPYFAVVRSASEKAAASAAVSSADASNKDPQETTSAAAGSAATGSGAPSSGKGGGGLSGGAIAGIVIGVVGGLLLIAAAAFFLLRKRRQNKNVGENFAAGDSPNAYMVDKETQGRATDTPNSPYSDENQARSLPIDEPHHDGPALISTAPMGGVPRTSTGGSQNSRAETPQGVSTNVAHLVEEGMTVDEIRRLEEEERQLDDEIERAARR